MWIISGGKISTLDGYSPETHTTTLIHNIPLVPSPHYYLPLCHCETKSK